jgi:hypothetical protein
VPVDRSCDPAESTSLVTPFHNRYQKLRNFRLADSVLGERQIPVTGLFGQNWSFLGAKDLHIWDG